MNEAEFPIKQTPTIKQDREENLREEIGLVRFAETGDPSYLTPAQIERLNIVVGSEGNVVDTAFDDPQIEARALASRGVDIEKLIAMRAAPNVVIDQLLPLALVVASRKGDEIQDVKEIARREISRFIHENPRQYVRELFQRCDPQRLSSLELIRYLEEELKLTAEFYEMKIANRSQNSVHIQTARTILEAFIKESRALQSRTKEENDGIYFVARAIEDFCQRIDIGGREDPDMYVPFEITKGTYAAFTQDKNRIYIADPELSGTIRDIYKEGWTSSFIEKGYDAAAYEHEYLPEDLIDAHDSVIDSGDLIADLFPQEFNRTPGLLQDYVTLMHSRFRAVIEKDLGFRLRDLTIREQIYFLEHAKTIRMNAVSGLRDFIATNGTSGLRMFLTVAADPKAGEEIMDFAKKASPSAVKQVFSAFGLLADEIEILQSFLEKEFGIDDLATISAVTDKLLHRGRDLLGKANSYKDDPKKLQALIERRSAKGQLLLSVFRTLKDKDKITSLKDLSGVVYEEISGAKLEGTTMLARMLAMYEKNHPDVGVELVAEFLQKLKQPGASVHTIYFGTPPELVAFMLITPEKDNPNEVEASALNVSQELAGVRPGPELIGKLVEMVATMGVTVKATAVEALAKQYRDQFGFEIIGPAAKQRSDGKIRYEIRLNPEKK